MSRKNKTLDDIRKYQKYFIIIFLPLFLLTAFKYNTSVQGSMFGVQISANIPLLIIGFIILSIATLFFFLYSENYNNIRNIYTNDLLRNHKQIVCAYSDISFGETVYEIEEDVDPFYRAKRKHVHTLTGEVYYFDDWRSFKFVGIKESRKLKLEHLKNVMNGN